MTNCPKCSNTMVLAQATAFGEEYQYCRVCKQELAEIIKETKPVGIVSPMVMAEKAIGAYRFSLTLGIGDLIVSKVVKGVVWRVIKINYITETVVYEEFGGFRQGHTHVISFDEMDKFGFILPAAPTDGSGSGSSPASQGLQAWTLPIVTALQNPFLVEMKRRQSLQVPAPAEDLEYPEDWT